MTVVAQEVACCLVLMSLHRSRVEPYPHQITAVYAEMLPRQPLRFLLADDPGAGKTIMAGLLIKELIIRGDLQRLKDDDAVPPTFATEKERVEKLAMEAVMAVEKALSFEPKDVSADKCGYDIESRDPNTGQLRFIEVKGRISGAQTSSLLCWMTTKNRNKNHNCLSDNPIKSDRLSQQNCDRSFLQKLLH